MPKIDLGQWVRYFDHTFRDRLEPVLQPGNGERFGIVLIAAWMQDDNGQMKNSALRPLATRV